MTHQAIANKISLHLTSKSPAFKILLYYMQTVLKVSKGPTDSIIQALGHVTGQASANTGKLTNNLEVRVNLQVLPMNCT